MFIRTWSLSSAFQSFTVYVRPMLCTALYR